MQLIKDEHFGGERPLFASHDLKLEGVVFEPGESALKCMGGKTKRAMLSERSEVGSRDVSVSYGAMS